MIKAVLEVINSATDVNGNRYWAFVFVDTLTGSRVQATTPHESNVTGAFRTLGLDWSTVYYTRQVLPKREFRRLTKEWEYSGCHPDAIAQYIRDRIKPQASGLAQTDPDGWVLLSEDSKARIQALKDAVTVLIEHALERYPHFESERGQADIKAAQDALAKL